jgi:hypothetical protein
MTKKEYNGWYNYETWNFALWFTPEDFAEDMESIVKDYVRADDAASCLSDADYQVLQFSDFLKDWFDDYIFESVPDVGSPVVADLLNGAVSEINFQDVSENWMGTFQTYNSTQGA